eukprot:TRINITY_DN13627_c0_g1_i1.p1 TRINITY_DN13627_c0_g1~~TRINITY_DN13627_c0_g1_i1.p1  ORF type:complete len:1416 (+),score=252.55 TRINITY_DN13627_c0_g1_i1:85-4332(+)
MAGFWHTGPALSEALLGDEVEVVPMTEFPSESRRSSAAAPVPRFDSRAPPPPPAVPESGASGRLGDDLVQPPREVEWGDLQRSMRRFHPDCGACGGREVADPPPSPAPVQWPPEWQPPERWGAGSGGAAGALQVLYEGLKHLRRSPGSVGEPRSPSPAPAACGEAEVVLVEPPSMLEWILSLPAQWAAAGFPPGFGNYLPWKFSLRDFAEFGAGAFHPCDIVCPARHFSRAHTGKVQACCVFEDAYRVLGRVLGCAEADPFALQPPDPPMAALQRLSPNQVVEGFLSAFLYTYNLLLPHGSPRRVVLPPGAGLGWTLRELRLVCVEEEGRAAAAMLSAGDCILAVGDADVESDAQVEAAIAQGAVELTVAPTRDQQRPMQLFGIMNWAMRNASTGVPDSVHIDRVLSLFKPLIWHLDLFIASMDREGGLLYRGISGVRVARHYSIGKYVLDPAFTSLTKDKSVAWDFTGKDGGTWQMVHITAALSVAWASQFPEEEEFLLGSNTVVVVMNKPTDDERQVLSTTHDAVCLAQVGDAAGGELRQLDPEEVLQRRVLGLSAHDVIYRDFVQLYVEPRVRHGQSREEGSGSKASMSPPSSPPRSRAAARQRQAACAEPESDPPAKQKLFEAFDDFLRSDHRWLLIIAPQGEGKSSALLRLYARELSSSRLSATQGAVPVFISLPLIPSDDLDRDWVPRQVQRQLRLDATEWGLLSRRGLLAFADSADEALLRPEALRSSSLAHRAGLPEGSKGVISVREDDLQRLGVTPAHLIGCDGSILHLQPFGTEEQMSYCRQLAELAVKEATNVLRDLRQQDGDARAAALGHLPGCVPDAEAAALHRALQHGGLKKIRGLEALFVDAMAECTLNHVLTLCPGEKLNALLFGMAAEAAADLSVGADSGSVIGAALRRQMRRCMSRVASGVWPAEASNIEDRVQLLMRGVEGLAAALTLKQTWTARLGELVASAEPLWECPPGASPELLRGLLPGIPLRTSDAEDPHSHLALRHRKVQEWLAGEWAARAAQRGRSTEGGQVAGLLRTWAGAWDIAQSAVTRVAEVAGISSSNTEEALKARGEKARQIDCHRRRARELRQLVKLCRKHHPERPVTADMLYWYGEALLAEVSVVDDMSGWMFIFVNIAGFPLVTFMFACIFLMQPCVDECKRVFRDARSLYNRLYGTDSVNSLLATKGLGIALDRSYPPVYKRCLCCSGGEALLVQARDGLAALEGNSSRNVLDCEAALGDVLQSRGRLADAEALFRRVLRGREQLDGHEHRETLQVLSLVVRNLALQGRWEEALPLQERCYHVSIRTLPQELRDVSDSILVYAEVLRHVGKTAQAAQLLRRAGLLRQRLWNIGFWCIFAVYLLCLLAVEVVFCLVEFAGVSKDNVLYVFILLFAVTCCLVLWGCAGFATGLHIYKYPG